MVMATPQPIPCTVCGAPLAAQEGVCSQCQAPVAADAKALEAKEPSLLQAVRARQQQVAQQLAPLEGQRQWWKKFL